MVIPNIFKKQQQSDFKASDWLYEQSNADNKRLMMQVPDSSHKSLFTWRM